MRGIDAKWFEGVYTGLVWSRADKCSRVQFSCWLRYQQRKSSGEERSIKARFFNLSRTVLTSCRVSNWSCGLDFGVGLAFCLEGLSSDGEDEEEIGGGAPPSKRRPRRLFKAATCSAERRDTHQYTSSPTPTSSGCTKLSASPTCLRSETSRFRTLERITAMFMGVNPRDGSYVDAAVADFVLGFCSDRGKRGYAGWKRWREERTSERPSLMTGNCH